MSVSSRTETKKTSARKGDLPPNGRPSKAVRSGMLLVERVCRPGPNSSRALPSRTKMARWLSRTTSWEPSRNSPEAFCGSRWTISLDCSFGYSIRSRIAIAAPLLAHQIRRRPAGSSPADRLNSGIGLAGRGAGRLGRPAAGRGGFDFDLRFGLEVGLGAGLEGRQL